MKCLNCTAALAPKILEDIEIDACPECSGIWLDGGELELLLESPEAARHYLHSFDPGSWGGKAKTLQCPLCKKPMEKVLCGKGKVPVEKCAEDHGVWCGGGELECLLEFADAGHPKVSKHLEKLFSKRRKK